MEEILEEEKIGEHMAVGVQQEEGEIGMIVASEDVSASLAFLPDEWDNFVEAVNEADRRIQGE